jgi:hypothetical protein
MAQMHTVEITDGSRKAAILPRHVNIRRAITIRPVDDVKVMTPVEASLVIG